MAKALPSVPTSLTFGRLGSSGGGSSSSAPGSTSAAGVGVLRHWFLSLLFYRYLIVDVNCRYLINRKSTSWFSMSLPFVEFFITQTIVIGNLPRNVFASKNSLWLWGTFLLRHQRSTYMELGAKNVTGQIWQTVFVAPCGVECLLLKLPVILVYETQTVCSSGLFCILLVLPLILPDGSASL